MNFFDNSMMAINWWFYPFNPMQDPTYADPKNELDRYTLPAMSEWYDRYYDKPKLRAQQEDLVKMITGATSRYGNIFYVPMNEPSYFQGSGGGDAWNAARWHDWVVGWADEAYVEIGEIPPPGKFLFAKGEFIMGENIYGYSSTDGRTACLGLINHMTRNADIKVFSFHTPFWKTSAYPECNDDMNGLVTWFYDQAAFGGKAIIIDTDGDMDMGTGCRSDPIILRRWAAHAYGPHGDSGPVSFNTKGTLWPPNELLLRAVYNGWVDAGSP